MQQSPKHYRVPGRQTAGFTLIELMISIAMVLLLVAGINAVFQAATKTTGTGMAVEEMTRSMRGTERLLSRDFTHAVPVWEMPCLTIYSMQQFAFRNRGDMNNDPDGKPDTIDLNGDGKEGNIAAETIYNNPFTYNDRNHRIDRVGFFARDVVTPFQCQTGELPPLNSSKDPLVTPDKSTEAWIWYGHLRVPTMPAKPSDVVRSHGGIYYDPGEANAQDNVHNFFFDDWCFGRMAILLKDLGNVTGDESYIRQSSVLLSPLGQGSLNSTTNALRRWRIEESRFDIADTSVREFREYLSDQQFTVLDLIQAFDYRFNCKPWAARVPLGNNSLIKMGNELALTVPFLQRGVSQFVVEYAGDFIQQDPTTGKMTGLGPDGEIDYVLIPDQNDYPNLSTSAQVARATKKIRWYGMPRNVDRRNDAPNGLPSIPTDPIPALISEDVLPLRDIVPWNNYVQQDAVRRIERFTFWNPKTREILTTLVPKPKDYANFKNPQPGMNLAYYCNWNADELQDPEVGVPSMIRIVMTLSDVNGRLPEGQTVEYVFKLAK